MTPERWRQITEIFHGAVAIGDAAAREAYLHDACGEDPSVRAEVESLLAAHTDPSSFIDQPILQTTVSAKRLEPGTMLGRYRVEHLIGRGGMGEVYRARDTHLPRTVALKILPTHLRDKPQLLARLKREAETIAALNHPCICTLIDVGRQDDIDFLVMEFVDGEPLSSRIGRGRLSIDEAIRLTREVAEALSAAHVKGIIHRDIKPSNVIVTPGEHVKVVDFGLAKESSLFRSEETTREDPTEPGVLIGTPRYMSPEQALGQPLDPRTDLFALGVVLFECLTGELPFEGETRYQYLQNLLSGPVKPVAKLRADVPADLQVVLARCLERDASKRLDSAAWLATELDRIVRERGVRRPIPVAAWAGGIAVLATVAALAVILKPAAAPAPAAGTDIYRLIPFTTSAGEESDSHFSPDEVWMSYIKTERGQRSLFVQQVDGGQARPVTLPAGRLLSHVWSSPGQSAYACLIEQASGLSVHIVETYFGGNVPLQTFPLPERWRNPKLLRWIARTIYLQVTDSGGRWPSLQRLDLDSGRFEPVAGPWSDKHVWAFDVGHDGRQVVWAAEAGSERDDLWMADINGASPRPLTDAADEFRKRFPLWNRLGTSVVYQSNRGGQVDLWELDVNSGRSIQRSSDTDIERPESTSKSGSISYQLLSQKTALWIWKARDGKGTQVTGEGLSDFAPNASSAGRIRVAFQRSQPSPVEGFLQMDTDIFVADVTNPATRLEGPKDAGTGFAPRLSPDGRRLAFLQRGSPGSPLAQLLVRNVDTSTLEGKQSIAVPLPSSNNFPVDWTEQNVAWASSDDLYFVERADTSKLVHHRVGSAPISLPATATTGRLTNIYPSSDGKTVAYITSRRTRDGQAEEEHYQLHTVDTSTGAHRVVHDLGPQYLVHFRGWLRDDAGLVLARSVAFDEAERTWTLELLVVAPDGKILQKGTIDHVVYVSQLMVRDSELYFTHSAEGVGNLSAYSFATRKVRQVTDNLVLDATFGSVTPLGLDYLVGIRHEQTKDIRLLDARPRARRASRNR